MHHSATCAPNLVLHCDSRLLHPCFSLLLPLPFSSVFPLRPVFLYFHPVAPSNTLSFYLIFSAPNHCMLSSHLSASPIGSKVALSHNLLLRQIQDVPCVLEWTARYSTCSRLGATAINASSNFCMAKVLMCNSALLSYLNYAKTPYIERHSKSGIPDSNGHWICIPNTTCLLSYLDFPLQHQNMILQSCSITSPSFEPSMLLSFWVCSVGTSFALDRYYYSC